MVPVPEEESEGRVQYGRNPETGLWFLTAEKSNEVLYFTDEEWIAFKKGALEGQFV